MKIRNIAIIAHVDHGKTTLVDELLKQSGTFRENQSVEVRVMDSNDLERERGITILAKCTSVFYKDYKINIIDTPGHADFGGEVERILGMVEGVILLVDAQEGAMPQTRFVTQKALSLGLKPIVLINKMDKPGRRPKEVVGEVEELFINLDANEDQLFFTTLYAAARDGWISTTEEKEKDDVSALFETVINEIKEPQVDKSAKFAMAATMIANDDYVGRMLTGKIASGTVKVGDNLKALDRDGNLVEKSKVSKLMVFEGLTKKAVEVAEAGEIICLAGFTKATVSDTVCDLEIEEPLVTKPIDPPVISMTFSVNDSPLAKKDKDSKKVTSREILDRLLKEQETNVSIKVKVNNTGKSEELEVSARGELQLAILIETMRREGFELSIGRPKVLIKEENGIKMEPMEEVQIDVDHDLTTNVTPVLQKRKAILINQEIVGDKTRLTFIAPTRGLIGYYSKFLTDTKGTGIMARSFKEYKEMQGEIETRFNGVLISNGKGNSTAYDLFNLKDRGIMFIDEGEEVYEGMIIGEHSKDNDLEVNVIRGKALTNMRASGKDDTVKLAPAQTKSLEEAIAYIEEDEMIEVTPNFLRIRKKYLDPNERKKHSRK